MIKPKNYTFEGCICSLKEKYYKELLKKCFDLCSCLVSLMLWTTYDMFDGCSIIPSID